ncbi:hypothetical protein DUNSADRAFT_11977 [Dunaliella salina]|uniref:dihydropyrimidinase n=1 Tax=Dunaliella salina TaxID=3046 RepID=A0ABQ7GC97_DUNSA|nr:hypothetical protein DUNSADRAFT_11977 [Dunaliella salina]|eukprot:KAF5832220.1 hypothetical protein DUNSADRAFT_11977 [Dunaliella salina]
MSLWPQAAALAGGTTMHIDFALPVQHDLLKGWQEWQAKASTGCMDYSFHMAITNWSSKGSLQVTDEELLMGMAQCKELGALPMVHAENGDAVAWGQRHVLEELGITGPEGHALSRPPYVEGEATGRAIRLARLVGVPLYVVHIMSEDALKQVAEARLMGQRVIGEPVASGLSLHEDVLWNANWTQAAQYVMSPPIRGPHHRTTLKQALAGGVLQLVATDHASFNSTQKAVGRHDFRLIPNGVHGLEERMHIVWEEMVNSGLITPMDFVRVTSTAAAQIFNMYPRKGRIAAGSDADVIVFDPEREHVLSAASHHHNNDLNVYEGRRIKGFVETTISRGRLVWQHGQLNVESGSGRFVPLPLHGPLFDGLPKPELPRQEPGFCRTSDSACCGDQPTSSCSSSFD